MIKAKKKEYYTGRIITAKNPSKELHNIIKEFKNPASRKQREATSQTMCDNLSDHFKTKIEKFQDKIQIERQPQTDATVGGERGNIHDKNTPHGRKTLSQFRELTPTEFTKLVKDSSKSGSPDDPCPAHIMRELLLTCPHLLESTRILINTSLREGIVNRIRKSVVVKPLLKKPSMDPENPDNYRAVTNNGYLAKLEERAAFLQLSEHAETEGLLDDHQVGFRKGRSTETATTAIWDDIKLRADANEATALILLDLSAAFDTVHHEILLTRLANLGIVDKANQWIRSFLTDRKQTTWMPPHRSTEKAIDYGVPQGASISPLLFNLYMSPLPQLIRDCGIEGYNYADDTQLVVTFQDPKRHPPPKLKECMITINRWTNDNHLVLNPKKTIIMLTGNPKCYPESIPWPDEMGQAPMTTEECINLGIVMNRKISLKKHCNKTARSCNYQSRLLRKIFPYLAFPQKLTAATSYILSRLDFANSILLGTSNENLHCLQRAQNIAARMVLNLGPRDHMSRALYELHWLPIGNRVAFKSLCIAHKAVYAQTKNFLLNRFRVTPPNRPRRDGGAPLLTLTAFNKMRAGGSTFVRTSSKLWNTLPGRIRKIQDHMKFRRYLKTWLFPSKEEADRGNGNSRISYLPATEDRGLRRLQRIPATPTTIVGTGRVDTQALTGDQ